MYKLITGKEPAVRSFLLGKVRLIDADSLRNFVECGEGGGGSPRWPGNQEGSDGPSQPPLNRERPEQLDDHALLPLREWGRREENIPNPE
jgi:hypothetical protein